MQEVRPGLFVEDRFSSTETYRGCNYGFVTTGDGIVAIDSPEWPADAVSYRDEVSDRGEIRFLVNTHEHFDHVAGNYYLPGTVISHEKVRTAVAGSPSQEDTESLFNNLFGNQQARDKQSAVEEIDDNDLDWETVMRLIFEDMHLESLQYLNGYQMKPPTITFRDEATLHVGDCTFELLHLPGHTESHICVHVPERKVVFAGDNVATGCYPSLALSHPLTWIESLLTLEDLDVDCVIPGHGPVGDKSDITAFREFLETCIQRTRNGIDDGLSKAEIADHVSFADCRPPVHPNDASHRDDMERLYEVLK